MQTKHKVLHLKRERNLSICFITLLIAYFVVLFFLNDATRKDNWFYIALLFESAYMFIKSYLFKSDSSLYFAVVIFALSLFGFFTKTYFDSTPFLISIFILSFCFAHFFVFATFKKYAHFYTSIFLFLLFLPIFLYSFNCINLILMVSSICGVFLLIFLAGIFVIYGKI